MSWDDRIASWFGYGPENRETRDYRQEHHASSVSPSSRTVEGAWHGERQPQPGRLPYGIGYGNSRSRLEAHDSSVGFRPEDRDRYMNPSYDYESGSAMGMYAQDAVPSRSFDFAGRGPKGYRRDDEFIREEVCELLTVSPIVDASEIEVSAENGEVILTGKVPTRGQKRLAEDIAEHVRGVRDVRNRLEIANLF